MSRSGVFGSWRGGLLLAIVLPWALVAAGQEVCDNGVDDDEDGRVDCADPDCTRLEICERESDCTDGVSNDLDTLVDCADPDCAGTADCPGEEICNDGWDNDGDGRIDCLDCDCYGNAICIPPHETDCNDGLSNDCDDLIDCEDPECDPAYTPNSGCPEGVCWNRKDDDGDGLADCYDPDCNCPEPRFLRGDADGDGARDLGDAVLVARYLFVGENYRFDCLDAMDANDDGELQVTDAIRIAVYLFLGGPPLPDPLEQCGLDETDDPLGCWEIAPACRA